MSTAAALQAPLLRQAGVARDLAVAELDQDRSCLGDDVVLERELAVQPIDIDPSGRVLAFDVPLERGVMRVGIRLDRELSYAVLPPARPDDFCRRVGGALDQQRRRRPATAARRADENLIRMGGVERN
jgi:hypothetical protein